MFVMSDVVGSTGLWELHGDAMGVALELHDRVVHGVMVAAGGRVFKHTGDGMIAVFDDADAAVGAAVQVVAGLVEVSWGVTGPLGVRVAVHAGQAEARDNDFFGPTLNRLSRINKVAGSGQVLVSDVARGLMRVPVKVDLGVHQLRDVGDPLRLWQADDGQQGDQSKLQSVSLPSTAISQREHRRDE